jgi:GGDEF domain-containing protein
LKRTPLRQWLALLVLMLWHALAGAVPQIDWSDQIKAAAQPGQRSTVSVDLHNLWESTIVGGVTTTNAQFFDPDQVWYWPEKRFNTRIPRQAYVLHEGDRLLARLQIFSEKTGTELNLNMQMPRLDAAHVSYRYEGGPWTTLSAGDTLAMSDWNLPDRQPSFNIPLLIGRLDVVAEIAHRGNAYSPIVLQNDVAYLSDLTISSWVMGALIGVNMVLALMGVLLALNFRRSNFLGVSLMTFTMSVVLFFNSGLGGLYFGAHVAGFNDQIKFFGNNVWCMSLPWVAAVSMSLRYSAKRCWLLALVTTVGGTLLTAVWMDYSLRDTAWTGVPAMLTCVIVMTLLMAMWAWFRAICQSWTIMAGIVAYIFSLIAPYFAFLGLIGIGSAGLVAALLCMLSALLLMRGLYLQHRMGRHVMTRANISPQRDVLTGLLNRKGLEVHLLQLQERMRHQQTCAAFCYLNVADAETAQQILGEEGFEMGMVQIAASLSSTISGVDGLARISQHAFAITVLMPPDPELGTRMAQKVLSRMMALASHGTPLASSARIAMAWLPLFGFKVDSLERRALRTLVTMDSNKRIGWVGGQESHAEAAQMLRDERHAYSTPSEQFIDEALGKVSQPNGVVSNLSDRIRRIEREMLQGVDTKFLLAEAERMSRLLNQSSQSQDSLDHQPTQVMNTLQMSTQSPYDERTK